MDATRILSLRDQVERAAVSTAVILLTFSNISGFVIPAHAQTLKVIIKKHIDILLEDFKEDPDLLRYFFMITIFMKLPFIHYQVSILIIKYVLLGFCQTWPSKLFKISTNT